MEVTDVYVTNLIDYTNDLGAISHYLQLIFYALAIIIVLNIIKGV